MCEFSWSKSLRTVLWNLESSDPHHMTYQHSYEFMAPLYTCLNTYFFIFKQYYIYFHTLFYLHIFFKKIKNCYLNTRTKRTPNLTFSNYKTQVKIKRHINNHYIYILVIIIHEYYKNKNKNKNLYLMSKIILNQLNCFTLL